ncbi:hypothetical protein PUN28_017512 [Cardiocondyla obscurior]|uniref:Fatty acyl-CoA reductase n=1 Tax=Cardiocondyla obscurior TaxID=286306 RepID=A0AAW2EJ62_9HYME
MTPDSSKSIPTFYAGQSILLTGATGFMGKVFIEKVLRTCSDVREIFLVIRPKKGLSVNQRLEKILHLPLYERLRNERPFSFQKLIPISGDATEKGFGLSASDRQMLIERVTIIVHGSASVRFNNTLQFAIFTNTRATRDICILAQNMKNLLAVVHISTAFAHVNESIVEEKVYPSIADWRKMITIAESLDEHTLNIFTAKCLEYAPNTYIFTKNLSERIILDYSSSLPCAIIRPSSVSPSIKEPMPGWIDNLYGPIGLYVGGGKGIVRIGHCKKSTTENNVPVDAVINAILVTTWKLGLTSPTADSTVFVLNFSSQKSFSFKNSMNILSSIIKETPFEKTLWVPNTILTDNLLIFYVLTILLHILPAIIFDSVLYVSGRRPMLLKLMRRLYVANRAVSYFSFHERKFDHENRLNLLNSISPNDLEEFSFDYTSSDIREYCRIYLFATIFETTILIGLLWIIYKYMYSL